MQAPYFLRPPHMPHVLPWTRSGSRIPRVNALFRAARGGRITFREGAMIAAFHPVLTVFGILNVYI